MVGRYELSEAKWRRICGLLAGRPDDPGRSGADEQAVGSDSFRLQALKPRSQTLRAAEPTCWPLSAPRAISAGAGDDRRERNALTRRGLGGCCSR